MSSLFTILEATPNFNRLEDIDNIIIIIIIITDSAVLKTAGCLKTEVQRETRETK